jgi:phage shock protein A
MAGLRSRIALLAKGKLSAALDRAEDPREILDYAHEQQRRQLVEVKRGLVEVATSRARLERAARTLRERVPACEGQAQRALELGREETAREALRRKHAALAELEGLETQIAEVAGEEQRLAAAQRQLAARVDEFASHRTIVSARYSSAQARVRAAETLAGVSGELAELGLALGRAEEKTERLQARAGALDELIESGALDPPWGGADALGQELRRLVSARDAEAELEELRRELAGAPAPPELDP